jgi:hypothetical protein
MTMRWDIINRLLCQTHDMRYLEIGADNGECLRNVNAFVRWGVDPNPHSVATVVADSDSFFRKWKWGRFDLVFIDGLHTEAQTLRDIENALQVLTLGGRVVVHDVLPGNEQEARDLSEYDGNGVWTGTVWKAWARLRMERLDLGMVCYAVDCGVGVITPGMGQVCFPKESITWALYAGQRDRLMNVKEAENA